MYRSRQSELNPSADAPQAAQSPDYALLKFAREASIEINVQDTRHLESSRRFLAPGTKLYVSHLPGQAWKETVATCHSVRAAGFNPVPHLPVRLVAGSDMLHHILEALRASGAWDLLLISGDYPSAAGPYSAVASVLQSGLLQQHGIGKVCVAGHPEGHPKGPLEEIRRAERDKVSIAAAQGLQVTLLTQFVFESGPLVEWARAIRAAGLQTRLVA